MPAEPEGPRRSGLREKTEGQVLGGCPGPGRGICQTSDLGRESGAAGEHMGGGVGGR